MNNFIYLVAVILFMIIFVIITFTPEIIKSIKKKKNTKTAYAILKRIEEGDLPFFLIKITEDEKTSKILDMSLQKNFDGSYITFESAEEASKSYPNSKTRGKFYCYKCDAKFVGEVNENCSHCGFRLTKIGSDKEFYCGKF
jgi:hypothetical protein